MKKLFNLKLGEIKKLGEGSYGSVFRTYPEEDSDKPDSEKRFFAIKKMEKRFFSEGINFSALREIKILKEINNENIIKFLDVFYDKQNLYISYEYLNKDLAALRIEYTEPIIKAIIYQIIKGLVILHDMSVIHRDLKPENILLSKSGKVKIGDFGMSRFIASPERGMTRNVVTNYYRSPELFFGSCHYSFSVDMWSLGCIIAELFIQEPLFHGRGDLEILVKIFSLLGVPDNNSWEGVFELINFKQFSKGDVIGLRNKFGFVSLDMLDLLEKLLVCDPNKRISAREALEHKCFRSEPYMISEDELKAIFEGAM